jgi:hypothetical protein
MAGSLPSVDPRAAEIIKAIGEFEASVQEAEGALLARAWERIEQLLANQHRLTSLLANLLDETSDIRPPAFSAEVDRRLQQITDQRADQLRRLIAFNHLVKQRLTMIAKSRPLRQYQSNSKARILDLRQ